MPCAAWGSAGPDEGAAKGDVPEQDRISCQIYAPMTACDLVALLLRFYYQFW